MECDIWGEWSVTSGRECVCMRDSSHHYFFTPTAPISPICRTPLFPYLTFYSSLQDIAAELKLPPVKLHCSMLAEDAIKAAIKDYKSKQGEEKSEGEAAP